VTAERLSALDASFLAVETPSAPMHIGWVAAFDPPEDGPSPTFAELAEHIAGRLERAPRYIGIVMVAGQVCFGIFADAEILPDADALGSDLDAAFDELLAAE
jgi:diacylglycerol O-acyltransferase